MTARAERVQVEELAYHLHLGPLLAEWHVEEFGHLYDPEVWNLDVAIGEFAVMHRPGVLPATFVAFDGAGRGPADVLGSVSLVATDDLDGFEHLTPWLASLYVRPDARGRGVGSHLVDVVLAHARSLGHDRLHLFTDDQEDWYLDRGWRPLARPVVRGTPSTVMVRATAPTAARRAVSSTWCTDPDTLGAYSYLRVGGAPADRDALAGEVLPHLWLAGEATWREHPATMHGAWFSGERAARQVLDHVGGDASVLVVGAGLAGIAAARALTSAGVRTVVVESKPHVGGRAVTDRRLGVAVPLGGAWLHGVDGHPLAGLVETHPDPWPDTNAWWADHGRVDDASVAAALDAHARFHAALDGAAPDESAGDVLDRVLQAERSLSAAARATFERLVLLEMESLYAAPLHDVSARNGLEAYELPGGDQLITSDVGAAVEALAAGLDVRLGHRVEHLERGGDHWRTDSGLTADAVVVTVPVGALRAGTPSFEPPLPAAVTGPLDRLGAGPVTKLFVTYDSAWWPPVRAMLLAGDAPFVIAVDMTPVTGRPVLCWFAVGDDARRVEAMSEDEQCTLVDDVARRAGLQV